MSRRWAARVDGTQGEIVEALRKAGCSVHIVRGEPFDLVVGVNGRNALLDLKLPKGKLRPSQVEFHAAWRGQYAICRSMREVFAAVCVKMPKGLER